MLVATPSVRDVSVLRRACTEALTVWYAAVDGLTGIEGFSEEITRLERFIGYAYAMQRFLDYEAADFVCTNEWRVVVYTALKVTRGNGFRIKSSKKSLDHYIKMSAEYVEVWNKLFPDIQLQPEDDERSNMAAVNASKLVDIVKS